MQLVQEQPGPKPEFSNSEVLALELVRQLEGETSERGWVVSDGTEQLAASLSPTP